MQKMSWRERRYAPLIVLGLAFCAGSFLLRIVFANAGGDHQALTIGEVAASFALGLYFDVAAYLYAAVPLTLYLLVAPAGVFHRLWHRPVWMAFCWALVFGTLFLFVSEWFFWQEFRTRFNFIAVDYLLYTREVIGNIRESYPVGRILMVLAALAGLIVWLLRNWLLAPLRAPAGSAGKFRCGPCRCSPRLSSCLLGWTAHSVTFPPTPWPTSSRATACTSSSRPRTATNSIT